MITPRQPGLLQQTDGKRIFILRRRGVGVRRVDHFVAMLGDRHFVARQNPLRIATNAVDLDPVATVQVANVPIPVDQLELTVMRRDVGKPQSDVATAAAADDQLRLLERNRITPAARDEFAESRLMVHGMDRCSESGRRFHAARRMPRFRDSGRHGYILPKASPPSRTPSRTHTGRRCLETPSATSRHCMTNLSGFQGPVKLQLHEMTTLLKHSLVRFLTLPSSSQTNRPVGHEPEAAPSFATNSACSESAIPAFNTSNTRDNLPSMTAAASSHSPGNT